MIIRQVRYEEGDKYTHSKIMLVDDLEEKLICFALEDVDRRLEDGGEKIYGKTAIPLGAYRAKVTRSNRFKRDTIQLLDVPQFTGIRVHSGNKSADTEGCILPGVDVPYGDWISNSRPAEGKLIVLVESVPKDEEVWWEVVRCLS